jgi:hypothetical protein
MLGLGAGAVTAILSIVDTGLFRPRCGSVSRSSSFRCGRTGKALPKEKLSPVKFNDYRGVPDGPARWSCPCADRREHTGGEALKGGTRTSACIGRAHEPVVYHAQPQFPFRAVTIVAHGPDKAVVVGGLRQARL